LPRKRGKTPSLVNNICGNGCVSALVYLVTTESQHLTIIFNKNYLQLDYQNRFTSLSNKLMFYNLHTGNIHKPAN